MSKKTDKKKLRRFSLLSRLIAALAIISLAVIVVCMIFIEVSMTLIALLLVACTGLIGPSVAAAPASIVEIAGAFLQLTMEAITTIIEAIASLFSGFGG